MATGKGGRIKRLARPARVRVSLFNPPDAGTPLPLPARRMWLGGLIIGVFFVIFAAVWWIQVRQIRFSASQTTFDVAFNLFNLFWVLGWSVGVVVLGLLTVLFLFYSESARICNDRLITVSGIGPVKIFSEYLLRDIRNLRTVKSGSSTMVAVRFDYALGERGLGDAMPLTDAEALIALIEAAIPQRLPNDEPTATTTIAPAATAEPAIFARLIESALTASGGDRSDADPPDQASGSRRYSASTIALLLANLVPLGGVLFLNWGLGNVMVLFWAESAVIGFYTLLKMAVVGKIAVIFAGPFFLGHFGGFMAGHFLFIDGLFLSAGLKPSEQPLAIDTILMLLTQLWPALLALVISHGISFFWHFIGQHEYRRLSLTQLMTAPYRRIIVMHVAIIFGGFAALALKTPLAVLVILIVLKIGVDLHAHLREHGALGTGNRK